MQAVISKPHHRYLGHFVNQLVGVTSKAQILGLRAFSLVLDYLKQSPCLLYINNLDVFFIMKVLNRV
jgi:hypothetical protein